MKRSPVNRTRRGVFLDVIIITLLNLWPRINQLLIHKFLRDTFTAGVERAFYCIPVLLLLLCWWRWTGVNRLHRDISAIG
jgi:hypothetical protein